MKRERLAENLLLAGNVLAAISLLLTSLGRIFKEESYEQKITTDQPRRGGGYFDL